MSERLPHLNMPFGDDGMGGRGDVLWLRASLLPISSHLCSPRPGVVNCFFRNVPCG